MSKLIKVKLIMYTLIRNKVIIPIPFKVTFIMLTLLKRGFTEK